MDPEALRFHVLRTVQNRIHHAARSTPERHDACRAELLERLDRPDFTHDLLTRPVDEVIEELSQDLGVVMQGRTWNFPRRTPADVDLLRAQAAAAAARYPPDT